MGGAMPERLAGLRGQIIDALRVAMRGDGVFTVKQTDLAKAMGVTPKHVNQMLKHEAGTFDIFDVAAAALGKRWVVTLEDQ